jgi:hypothetical protein
MAKFAVVIDFFRCFAPFFLFGTRHAFSEAKPVRRRLKIA